jgi:hypothetical protein
MKAILKAIVLCGVVAGLSLLALVLWVARPRCEQEVIESLPSPDGRYIASTVTENCHATTPVVTLVTIRTANRDLSRSFYSNKITDS